MPPRPTPSPLKDIRLSANAAGPTTSHCDLRVSATVHGTRYTAVATYPVDDEAVARIMATCDVAGALERISAHPASAARPSVGLHALLPHGHALTGMLLEDHLHRAAAALRTAVQLHRAWQDRTVTCADDDAHPQAAVA